MIPILIPIVFIKAGKYALDKQGASNRSITVKADEEVKLPKEIAEHWISKGVAKKACTDGACEIKTNKGKGNKNSKPDTLEEISN